MAVVINVPLSFAGYLMSTPWIQVNCEVHFWNKLTFLFSDYMKLQNNVYQSKHFNCVATDLVLNLMVHSQIPVVWKPKIHLFWAKNWFSWREQSPQHRESVFIPGTEHSVTRLVTLIFVHWNFSSPRNSQIVVTESPSSKTFQRRVHSISIRLESGITVYQW